MVVVVVVEVVVVVVVAVAVHTHFVPGQLDAPLSWKHGIHNA